TITIDDRPVALHRYSVSGLAWGIETLWMDRDGNLAALVTRDAEFDHFEALRDDLEPALSKFISSAAADAMTELEAVGRALPGRRTGLIALVGATLIDGTGRPPLANATVIVNGGRIL